MLHLRDNSSDQWFDRPQASKVHKCNQKSIRRSQPRRKDVGGADEWLGHSEVMERSFGWGASPAGVRSAALPKVATLTCSSSIYVDVRNSSHGYSYRGQRIQIWMHKDSMCDHQYFCGSIVVASMACICLASVRFFPNLKPKSQAGYDLLSMKKKRF